jgi:integrase/recombinase XerD
MLEAGVDLIELQQILGHVSVLTTSRYTHLTSKTKSNAHQALNTLVNSFDITWGGVK